MNPTEGERCEWLEADGLGGYASGTVSLVRTRRYHGLLVVAAEPPSERTVLVSGIDAWIEHDETRYWLSSQRYEDRTIYPDGADRIGVFVAEPWPAWHLDIPGVADVRFELLVPPRTGSSILRWQCANQNPDLKLFVRPLLANRFFHSLERFAHREVAVAIDLEDRCIEWSMAEGRLSISARANGMYRHDPSIYRGFRYEAEHARGLDFTEDLVSPGVFEFDLGAEPAALVFNAFAPGYRPTTWNPEARLLDQVDAIVGAERTRRKSPTASLERAADSYLVRGRRGRSVIAGYPWFGDWGRDTFIALRGLCLATGRLDEAAEALSAWANTVSEGMVPNRFPDRGEEPEYNSVDAALWYALVAFELIVAMRSTGGIPHGLERKLLDAVFDIIDHFIHGTRYGIRVDEDGLVAAGVPGVQLTWMDAKVGDRVITPRIGKPVEVQALWLNVLEFAKAHRPELAPLAERGRRSLEDRFFDEELGFLYDVVDENHETGRCDRSLRPNQLFTVGGLPYQLLRGKRAESIVEVCETRLWTPMGVRTLDPADPRYTGRYEGDPTKRDASYHQGTAWPWLAGAFIEAWVRTHGNDRRAKTEASRRFLTPLLEHTRSEAGLLHVSEIADGDAPHTPRGAPFQAWSLAEVLRMHRWLNER